MQIRLTSVSECNLPTNYTIIDAPSDSDSISSCSNIDGSLSLLLNTSPSSWPSDEASVDLGDVKTIEGDLVIYAHERPEKTKVTAEHLSTVDGELTIWIPDSASTVNALEISLPKLETVGTNYVITGLFKELDIKHDAALTVDGMMRVNDIAAEELNFPGVETVREDFSIDSNGELQRLQVDDLTTVEGSFALKDQSKLEDVSFPSLKTVKRDVTIQSNGALSIFELSALESAGTISFTSNGDDAKISFPRLSSLGGSNGTSTSTFSDVKEVYLSSLSKVNGALAFQSTSLDELTIPLLKTLNGSITVEDNPSLTTLALPRTSSMGDIFIESNDELSNFTANALRTVGTVSISGSALENVEFFGLEEVTGDFEVKGADGMDCSWFDEHIKTITEGKYSCKGNHDEKERNPSTGGIEDTEGNADDYIVTLSDDDEDEQSEDSDESSDSDDTPSEEKRGGLSTGAIAGMAAGIAVAALLIAVFAFWLFRRRRRQATPPSSPRRKESQIIAVSEQSSITHSISNDDTSRTSRHDDQDIFDGSKVGVQTRIEANIRVNTLSSAYRGGEAQGGFGSSVFHTVSETAYEVGFRVLNAIQSVRDRRKRITE